MVGANNADNNLTPEQAKKRMDTSKGLRTAGQAIFFALTCLWVLLVCNTFIKTVRRRLDTKARVACIMFSVIGAFLIARGLFGILQAAIYSVRPLWRVPAHTSSHTTIPRTTTQAASPPTSSPSRTVSPSCPSLLRESASV